MLKILIETTENGWIVTEYDKELGRKKYLFQTDGNLSLDVSDHVDVSIFCEVLRFIDDLIGPTTNRYSKKRIHVDTVQGDKFEDAGEEHA